MEDVMMTTGNQLAYSRSFLTKMRIVEAMNRLCMEKPFDKVHIDDIVRESGVSRSTFYHNFEDKNAAANWISNQCHLNGVYRIGRDLTWFEGHMISTRSLMKIKYLIAAAGEMKDYDSTTPTFVRDRCDNLRETIVEYQKKKVDEELEFQMAAYAQSEATMASAYRAGKIDCDIKTFCNYMTDIVPRKLYKTLEVPAIESNDTFFFGF